MAFNPTDPKAKTTRPQNTRKLLHQDRRTVHEILRVIQRRRRPRISLRLTLYPKPHSSKQRRHHTALSLKARWHPKRHSTTSRSSNPTPRALERPPQHPNGHAPPPRRNPRLPPPRRLRPARLHVHRASQHPHPLMGILPTNTAPPRPLNPRPDPTIAARTPRLRRVHDPRPGVPAERAGASLRAQSEIRARRSPRGGGFEGAGAR